MTRHVNSSSDENKNIIDTEECTEHDESENKKFTTESLSKPDESENNQIKTKSSETIVTETAPLPNPVVTDSNGKTKTNMTQDITVTVDEKKLIQSKAKSEVGKKNQKTKNQPKMKQISELKMLAKARRRIATIERRQAQKDFHYLSKQMEKINVKIEEECRSIQEELLTQYDDVFSAKLTADQRIKCWPIKLKLV